MRKEIIKKTGSILLSTILKANKGKAFLENRLGVQTDVEIWK